MSLRQFLAEWRSADACLTVHTSGSTGSPKPIRVEKSRMQASARATCRFLSLNEGDTALLAMPLDYIAGKMMVVRALTCGLRLYCVPPSRHPFSDAALEARMKRLDLVALVPLQIAATLEVPEERERLSHARNIIIGGGAIDDRLESQLRELPTAVWSSYGMTETLSHIALRRVSGPEADEWYRPFNGVTLSLTADDCLVIDAPAVCAERLVTNDRAVLRQDGAFRILGRKDNVVCSGGIKIQIEEAERLVAAHTAQPFCFGKTPDPLYGERMVLISEGPAEALVQLCKQYLPRYWQPRQVIVTDRLPRTETGKPLRRLTDDIF